MGLGFCSRLAGIALFGDMVMAMITVTWATGINSRTSPPGYQLNLALGVLALVVAIMGSGRFSLDCGHGATAGGGLAMASGHTRTQGPGS